MFYEAIFQPSAEMNYNSEAKKLAGKKIVVQQGWIVDDGPFKGQECFYISKTTVGWIPKCDLKELKPISFARWKEIHRTLDIDTR